jgi:hypothetical protein
MDRGIDHNGNHPPPPPRRLDGAASPSPASNRVASARDSNYLRNSGTVEQTPIAQCARVYFTRRDLLEAAPDDPVRAAEARVQWCRFIGQVCRACGLYPCS